MNPLNNLIAALKDYSVSIAREIRGLREDIRNDKKQVNLSLDAETIKRLNEGDVRKFTQLVQGLTNLANAQKISSAELTGAVSKLTKAFQGANNNDVVDAINSLSKTFSDKNMEVEVNVDTNSLLSKMEDVHAAILNSNAGLAESIKYLASIMQVVAQKKMPEYPSTIKLNDAQFSTLKMSGGGGLGGGGGTKAATKTTMANVSMASANTEYSYTFPANTVAWGIKLRSQGVLLLYAWDTGVLPTSGDGSAYGTVAQNDLRSIEGVEWGEKTIYLQTDTATQVAEIVSYQM